jgi:hypothetical protein
MSTSTNKAAAVGAFFLFNPLLGDEATEGRKILYFHPPETDLNVQKDYVGISEGLIAFTRDFSPDEPCEAVRCEKSRYAFLEAEQDFWLVLVVQNPVVVHKSDPPEYMEEELEDSVLQAILHRCYKMFRLFNGRIVDLVAARNMEHLKARFQLFMQYFIPTVARPTTLTCSLLPIASPYLHLSLTCSPLPPTTSSPSSLEDRCASTSCPSSP